MLFREIPPFPTGLWENPTHVGHALVSSRDFYFLMIHGVIQELQLVHLISFTIYLVFNWCFK